MKTPAGVIPTYECRLEIGRSQSRFVACGRLTKPGVTAEMYRV